ncbi:MAG: hypothetical protein KKB66_05055 [Alphaproteobacteria bacterium]|nr:hypothetical protein [Alphaproteobacteria bacterium]MBU0803164.1 hypothetical protein [Alphaproteobacteria bacterium]MBU0873852.1 hypothetical protein [Alphaproteobacteria bacterium]MBU1400648.1 hypothetical protein [Alphaproteobacteria bacterium]MBU1590521.1 hypothetical protein [Alphaproteobacteria bacterium]
MLLKALLVFLIAIIVFLVVAIFHDKGFIVFNGGMELASIMLAASSLVVTGVGVLAAILAVFGYGQIKDAALHEARTEARKVAAEVSTSVAGRVAREVRPSDTTDQEAADLVEALDKNGPA